ncbi:MAG: hypothetical protein EOP52_13685 [Sphingobacteriales bacterium]|nr:MAG: hypothetical protein EOP52_13685 [Sphingobacteriales bacterium]
MTLTKGNKALLEHSLKNKTLLLFQTHGKGKPVSYVSDFEYVDYEWLTDKDTAGNDRQAVVFHLIKAGTESADAPSHATSLQNFEMFNGFF